MCIYRDSDGHCTLYSSATVTSYCVEGPSGPTTFAATENGGKTMRPIDADQLKENINRNYIISDTINQAIDSAPTITPENLVRHGRWIFDSDDEYASHHHCDRCNAEIDLCNETYSEPAPNYCPNCGAKMEMQI